MSDAMVYVDLPTTRLLEAIQQQRLATLLASITGLGDNAPAFDAADFVLVMRWVMTGESPTWEQVITQRAEARAEFLERT